MSLKKELYNIYKPGKPKAKEEKTKKKAFDVYFWIN
jgi:hypothetical protein